MNTEPNVISFDERRRACRALRFFADLLGGDCLEDIKGLGIPVPGAKHLPRLGMDIAATRDVAPAHLRAVLAFARRRQRGFLLIRFRDPSPVGTEAQIDAVLFDGGIAVLEGLCPASANGVRWTLAGRNIGDIHLRVTKDELVPTLTDPWVYEEDRHSFISRADQIFADYVWRD
jgi:hypothetical protein